MTLILAFLIGSALLLVGYALFLLIGDLRSGIERCPHCGSKGKLIRNLKGKFFIICENPACRLRTRDCWTREDAIAVWNGGIRREREEINTW